MDWVIAWPAYIFGFALLVFYGWIRYRYEKRLDRENREKIKMMGKVLSIVKKIEGKTVRGEHGQRNAKARTKETKSKA